MGALFVNGFAFFFSFYNSDNITDDLSEGLEFEYEACLVSPEDDCKLKYHVKVRRCDHELQFFLLPTDGHSAYCLGKENKDVNRGRKGRIFF